MAGVRLVLKVPQIRRLHLAVLALGVGSDRE